MADILIRGMEMPKDGVYWCEISIAGEIATITIHGEDRKSFPLLPLPEGHGKGIDADKLFKEMFTASDGTIMRDRNIDGWPFEMRYADIKKYIRNAPIIVPADGGGEGC